MTLALRELQSTVQARLMGTRIVDAVMRGTVELAQYRRYLVDVHAYAQHSAQVIALAGARVAMSRPALAEYLFRHAGEELGHDRWAAQDLAELGVNVTELPTLQPSTPCLRMIGLEYLYAAHLNSVGLFGWMFVLETLGGSIGGPISARLDQVLGLHGRGLRFLRGHADADAHHSKDLMEVIGQHVEVDADVAAFRRMADETVDLYVELLDESFDGSAR